MRYDYAYFLLTTLLFSITELPHRIICRTRRNGIGSRDFREFSLADLTTPTGVSRSPICGCSRNKSVAYWRTTSREISRSAKIQPYRPISTSARRSSCGLFFPAITFQRRVFSPLFGDRGTMRRGAAWPAARCDGTSLIMTFKLQIAR